MAIVSAEQRHIVEGFRNTVIEKALEIGQWLDDNAEQKNQAIVDEQLRLIKSGNDKQYFDNYSQDDTIRQAVTYWSKQSEYLRYCQTSMSELRYDEHGDYQAPAGFHKASPAGCDIDSGIYVLIARKD